MRVNIKYYGRNQQGLTIIFRFAGAWSLLNMHGIGICAYAFRPGLVLALVMPTDLGHYSPSWATTSSRLFTLYYTVARASQVQEIRAEFSPKLTLVTKFTCSARFLSILKV